MVFTPIKPDSGPSPFLDAPLIQANFAQWAAIFSSTIGGIKYNHTAMNDPNQGDHEVVLMERQTVDPEVTQDLAVLYGKNASSNAGTQPQLFARIPKFLPTKGDPKNATNAPMQLTYNKINVAGPVFQSFLVGGYLIYFGTTSNIAANIVVSPVPTSLFLAIAAPQNVSTANTAFDVSTQIINISTFKINSTSLTGVYTVSWVAIGLV